MTRATLGPQLSGVWEAIPTTVLIGQIMLELIDAGQTPPDDVRVLDTDHFIILREPEVVSRTKQEILGSH